MNTIPPFSHLRHIHPPMSPYSPILQRLHIFHIVPKTKGIIAVIVVQTNSNWIQMIVVEADPSQGCIEYSVFDTDSDISKFTYRFKLLRHPTTNTSDKCPWILSWTPPAPIVTGDLSAPALRLVERPFHLELNTPAPLVTGDRWHLRSDS